jgi:hypothetical protein
MEQILKNLRHHGLAEELTILHAGWRRQVEGHSRKRGARAERRRLATLLMALLVGSWCGDRISAAPPDPPLPRLQADTLAAFERYVRLTDERNQAEWKDGKKLLWIDALEEGQRQGAYAALKSGEVQIEQLTTLDDGKAIRCPGGMIHHWVGVVYIPGAKLEEVLALLEDYDHQSTYYAPDVERSKIESREGEHFRVFLRFRRHKVVTVVLNTEHDIRYFRDSPTRAHSRSSATRIAEVENPGKPDEREKPPGDDGGFLWGMETWWRMEERDGGVYVQSEVASLTRDIPTGLGWIIGPFVNSIPRETLTFTLEATRKAVQAKNGVPAGS